MADKDNYYPSDRLFADGENDHDEQEQRLLNEASHQDSVEAYSFHNPGDSDIPGVDAPEDKYIDDKHKESFRNRENFNRSLSLLLQQLYSIAEQGGYDTSSASVICEVKAQNALEATAGDIDLSAQLYWDDFLASQENRQHKTIHLHRIHREARYHHQQHEHWLGLGEGDDRPIEGIAEETHRNRESRRVDLSLHVEGEVSSNAQETILRRRLEHSFNNYVDKSRAGSNRAQQETETNKKSGKKRRRRHAPRDNRFDTNRTNRTRRHESSPKLRDSSSGMENANSSSSSSSSGMWSDDNEEADNAEQDFLHGDVNIYQDRQLRNLEDQSRRQDNPPNNMEVAAGFNNMQDDGDVAVLRPAAAESVSVSDDEAAMAGLRRIFVEAKNFKTRKPRILPKPIQPDNDDNDPDGLAVSTTDNEQLHNIRIKNKDDTADLDSDRLNEGSISNSIRESGVRSSRVTATDNDDDDGYLSDNDWVWDSQTSGDVLAPLPPVDILWGGIKCNFNDEKLQEGKEGTVCPPACDEHECSASSSGSSKKKNKFRIYKENVVHSTHESRPVDKIDVEDSGLEQVDVNPFPKNAKAELKTPINADRSICVDAFNRIPYTWLNAGFQFCDHRNDTAYGLVLRPPDKDDIGYDEWKASSLWRGNSRNAVPPPYHCRSLTALISIVNGLLYTGVSIPAKGKLPGDSVSSASFNGSSRQPLVEITEEIDKLEKMQRIKQQILQKMKNRSRKEKVKDEENDGFLMERKRPTKQELDSRLADALSSLLSIAIRASNERKMKALKKFYANTGKSDYISQQHKLKLQRKMEKFPACWFDPENIKRYRDQSQNALRNSNVETTGGAKNDPANQVQVSVSYTNIEDVRSYVLGNLEEFKSSGGCALFLETVLRIHGKGAVARMIRRSREKRAKNLTPTGSGVGVRIDELAKEPCIISNDHRYLIHCTCEQRHKNNLERNPLFNRQRNASGCVEVYDTTPETHDCVSIEMISLLLTGSIQSTLEGWSCNILQLGLLSDVPGQVGKGLTRPEKPVWILMGPTCYSCLWLNGCNDRAASFSRIDDQIGTVAVLTHWNCWYNVRNKTKLRLASNRSKPSGWSVPLISTKGDDLFRSPLFRHSSRNAASNILDSLVESRFANHQRLREITHTEEIDPTLIVSKEELESVTVHKDDPKFYPGNYRSWRFEFSNIHGNRTKLDTDREHVSVVHENIGYSKKMDMVNGLQCEARVADLERTQNKVNPSSAGHDNDTRWKPYHRLSERQQLIVEMKFGQKLNCILWTRWPRATIDYYEPEDPPAVV